MKFRLFEKIARGKPTPIPENMVRFNALVARVLLHLYERHPHPCALVASDFVLNDSGLDSLEPIAFFEHTVEWLRNERFLQFSSRPGLQSHDPSFSHATLTERGLHTLVRPLVSLSAKTEQKTIGEQLKSAARATIGAAGRKALDIELAHIAAQIFGG